MYVVNQPESDVAKNISTPLIIGSLITHLINIFYVYIVWYYVGYAAVA